MKRIFWLAIIVLSVLAFAVGCRKDMLGSDAPSKDRGIHFSTHVGGVSKGVSRDRFVAGDAFEVVGYNAQTAFKDVATGAISMPATARLIFDANEQYFPFKRALVRASAVGDVLEWNYLPKIYWPAAGNVSFAAFSPAASPDSKITAAAATAAAIPSLSFEVFGGTKVYDKVSLAAARLENVHQVDLLHSMSLDIATEPVGGVELDFRHALTKVRFSVKGAQEEGILRIISVTLTGVTNKGTMDLIYNDKDAANIDYLGGWRTLPTDTLGFPVVLNSINSAAVDAGKVVSVVDDHEALLMIPQQLTQVKAHVVYAHSLDGGLTWQEYVSGDGTTELSLATSGVPCWKPNMSVHYIMEVNPGLPVLFTAELKSWGDALDQYVPWFEQPASASSITSIELEVDDVVTTAPSSDWITIKDATVVTPLARPYIVSTKSNYQFEVTENKGALRQAKIVITRGLGDFVRTITLNIKQQGPLGLTWATGNLVADGANGCKIGAPTDAGLYFQFGSLIGWQGGANGDGTGTGSPAGVTIQVKPSAYIGTAVWTTAGRYTAAGVNGSDYGLPAMDAPTTGIGDPCRYYLKGTWRTPTAAEYLKLMGASGANTNKSIPLKHNSYDLLFPAPGYRLGSDGSVSSEGVYGGYWSSSINNVTRGFYLYFDRGYVDPQYYYDRSYGFPVRCVSGTDVPLTPVNPPSDSEVVTINGLKWTKGNLVAKNTNECKVGSPTDNGIYFQYGSLVGWTGGTGNGTGTGSPALDKAVWPTAMGTSKPSYAWQNNNTPGISTLSNFYFNYSVAPWDADNTLSDIGTFAVTVAGQGSATGTLRSGRYANLGVGDPCTYYLGAPWRTPTSDEYLKLIGASGANTNKAVPLKVNSYDLSFPASGYRYYSNGSFGGVGSYGYYWSSSVYNAIYGYTLFFYSGPVYPQNYYDRSYGFPVRCVSGTDVPPPTPVNPPSDSEVVTINGLKWTKGNLVAKNTNECKVGVPSDGGLYFQFGSLIGYKGGAAANNGTGVGMPTNTLYNKAWGGAVAWSWSNDAMVYPSALAGNPTAWPQETSGTAHQWYFSGKGVTSGEINATDVPNGVGDPCTYYLGAPWRLPTEAEYNVLLSAPVNQGPWVTTPAPGRWFGVNPGNASSSIFIPASGYRYHADALFFYVTEEGYASSSSFHSDTYCTYLRFSSSYLYRSNSSRAYGYPVRCVASVP